jgi:AMIN domain
MEINTLKISGFAGLLAVGAVMLSAPIACAADLEGWQYDAQSNQLTFVLPDGVKPRFFVMAQPARIVLDIPTAQIGTVPAEQEFTGAVKRITLSQLQPQLTRVTLEMSPNVSFGRGQLKLENVGDADVPSKDRWVLTPILKNSKTDRPASLDIEPLTSPKSSTPKSSSLKPIETPKLAPVAPKNQPESVVVPPVAKLPVRSTLPPKPEPKPAEAPPGMESMVAPPAMVPPAALPQGSAALPSGLATAQLPRASAVTRSSGSAVKVPALSSLSAASAPVASLPETIVATEAVPFAKLPAVTPAIVASVVSPVPPMPPSPVMALGGPAMIPSAPAPLTVPGLPPLPPLPGSLSGSTSSPNESTFNRPIVVVDAVRPQPRRQTRSQPSNVMPSLPPVGPRDLLLAQSGKQKVIPTVNPSAGLPIFGSPTFGTPPIAVPLAANIGRPSTGVIEYGQPLPTIGAAGLPGLGLPGLSGQPLQALDNITTGGVTLPAGNVLSLRYDRLTTLKLKPGERQQEVLVLQTPILDGAGRVVVPQGSFVLGDFETGQTGSRFTARVLTTQTRSLSLLAQSNFLQSTRQVSSRSLIQNSGIGAVAGAIVGGLGGSVIGGAAAGAALTYAVSPRETTIQPGQVVEVRLVQDLLAARS